MGGFTSAAAVVLALIWAGTSQAEPDQVDHADSRHVVIGVTTRRLLPTVQVLEEGDAFAWINYSSRTVVITLDAAVAEHLTCASRGPFQILEDRLVADQIRSGSVASLCHLASGEYDYRVEIQGLKVQDASTGVLLGKLVVR